MRQGYVTADKFLFASLWHLPGGVQQGKRSACGCQMQKARRAKLDATHLRGTPRSMTSVSCVGSTAGGGAGGVGPARCGHCWTCQCGGTCWPQRSCSSRCHPTCV